MIELGFTGLATADNMERLSERSKKTLAKELQEQNSS